MPRTALLLALLVICASCVTLPNDPIVGCWQREGEEFSLIFRPNGTADFQLSEAAANSSVDYFFPSVRWSRRGPEYVLRFSRALQAAYTTTARIEATQLVMTVGASPMRRADSDTCVAWHRN